MPYIVKRNREALLSGECPPATSGELNFLFTCIIKDFVDYIGLSYQSINDVVGALEGAKAEFQRRIVAPYEDTKIEVNGDVY